MAIAKKEKGKIIKLYTEEANEIESYTLLHLDDAETEALINAGKWTPLSSTVLQATYETNDALDLLWKDTAQEHQKRSDSFKSVSKTFVCGINGTACLVRDPINHIIKIAFRKGNDTCRINRICIDDERRNLFFRDAKRTSYFKKTGKYAIDLEDKELYNYWSDYMNHAYLKGVK